MKMPGWLKKTLIWLGSVAAGVGAVLATIFFLSGNKNKETPSSNLANGVNDIANKTADTIEKTKEIVEDAQKKKETLSKETDEEVIENHLSSETQKNIETIKDEAVKNAMNKIDELINKSKNGG